MFKLDRPGGVILVKNKVSSGVDYIEYENDGDALSKTLLHMFKN